MNKEFIPYEQALELKELGFDEPCLGCYDDKAVFGLTVMSIKQYYTNSKEDTWNCAAPLYQQAFRWFREKYGLYSWVTMELGNKSTFCWVLSGEHTSTQYAAYFHTYEEAELACLNKLIEIVKNK
jgi:hypothetical protein